MNYFKAISKRCDELNTMAQTYFDGLEFIPDEECCERIWNKAIELLDQYRKEHPEDIEDPIPMALPDWAQFTLDNYVPFSVIPSNGSLYYSLGYAETARSANLRKLLEYVEGRCAYLNYFEVLAEKHIVDSYTDKD